MKFAFAMLLFLSLSAIHAEVSREHVEDMLKQMVRENVISADEAEKAKIKMQAMSPDQWAKINSKADGIASRMPASTPSGNKIEEVQNIDLNGAQFKQIQEDMKKIMPESRH